MNREKLFNSFNAEFNKNKKKVALLFGGKSAEHEISIITALQAFLALDPTLYDVTLVYIAENGKWYTGEALYEKKNYLNFDPDKLKLKRVALLGEPGFDGLLCYDKQGKIDPNQKIEINVCLLCFHGQKGEDGAVQGLLELAEIPYTGSPLAASAISMNKSFCKAILSSHGIPTLPWKVIRKSEVMHDFNHVIESILAQENLGGFPYFVKPCQLGSSIGISKAENIEALKAAIVKALIYDHLAIIEPCLLDKMEINVSVLGGEPSLVSVVEVPIASKEALSYEDKYLRGQKNKGTSFGMASLERAIDPKDLDPQIKNKVQDLALHGFNLLECSGVVRFDFLYCLKSGQLFFNELNQIPGSLSFYLWEKTNPRKFYTDILNQIIDLAIKRKKETLTLKQNLEFKALSN